MIGALFAAWIELTGITIWENPQHSIVYWDTSVVGQGGWPVKPQNVPPSGSIMLIPLNHQNIVIDELPWTGPMRFAILRVWVMTGTPDNLATCVPDIQVQFRAADDAAIWGTMAQAHGEQERQQAHVVVPLDELNMFQYRATYNACPGASYGVNMEWIGYYK